MRTTTLALALAVLAAASCGGGGGGPVLAVDADTGGPVADTMDGGKEICTPNCEGKECGPNGCDAECGICKSELEMCTDEGQCTMTPCDSSKDCPGSLVCDKEQGVCVVCVGDEDCPDGLTCGADHECHETYECKSDIDCKEHGMVCDKEAEKCVECLGPEECPEDQYCLQNYCVDDACTAGQSFCDGQDVVTCNDEGSADEVTESCVEPQYCEDGVCHDLVCTPSEQWCKGEVAMICSSDGKSVESEADCAVTDQFCLDGMCWECACMPGVKYCVGDFTVVECADNCVDMFETPCGAQKSCFDGECVLWFCEPSSVFCDGDIYKVCTSNGLNIQYQENCAESDKYCSVNGCIDTVCTSMAKFCLNNTQYGLCAADGMTYQEYDCPGEHYCKGGECLAWVCEPTVASCFGKIAKTCNPKGSGFNNEVDCGANVCVDGQCQELACQPNEDYCADNDTIGHCAADGMSFESENCAAGHSCKNGSCLPWVCTPGGPMCDGEMATTCDALGLGVQPGGQDCSLQGKSCADGVCVDCVPQCDGKECGDNGCGGSCGNCLEGLNCLYGKCTEIACSALEFDGQDDYVEMQAVPETVLGGGSKYVGMWLQATKWGGGLLQIGSDQFFEGHCFSFQMSLTGFLGLDVGVQVAFSDIVVPLNKWVYVFAFWDDTQDHYGVGMIHDGVGKIQLLELPDSNVTGALLWIGRVIEAPFPTVTGYIDEVRVSTAVPDLQEIIQGMFEYPDAGVPGLAAVWHFDEGEGDTVIDSSSSGFVASLQGPTWTTDSPFCGDGGVCGDGLKALWEQCDDSNLIDGDGCSATCHKESPACANGSFSDCNIPGSTLKASSAFVDNQPPEEWTQCAGFINTDLDDVAANFMNGCLNTTRLRVRVWNVFSGLLEEDVFSENMSVGWQWPHHEYLGGSVAKLVSTNWTGTTAFFTSTKGGDACDSNGGSAAPLGTMTFGSGNAETAIIAPGNVDGLEWRINCGGQSLPGSKIAIYR